MASGPFVPRPYWSLHGLVGLPQDATDTTTSTAASAVSIRLTPYALQESLRPSVVFQIRPRCNPPIFGSSESFGARWRSSLVGASPIPIFGGRFMAGRRDLRSTDVRLAAHADDGAQA